MTTPKGKSPISFDIETRPRPEDQLRKLCPDVDVSKFKPTEFDPDSVKLGNIKSPQLKADKVEAAKAKHDAEMAGLEAKLADAREQSWQSFLASSTLDASLSEVCCIGFYSLKNEALMVDAAGAVRDNVVQRETDVLNRFWAQAELAIRQGRCMVGVNIFNFDLPYLWRRSCVNNVNVPKILYSQRTHKWPAWNEKFVDLGSVWRSTTPPMSCKWGFDALAAAFGTDGKVTKGEIKGGDFWKFWDGSEDERSVAMTYLRSDVVQPAMWADAMGVR